MRNAALIIATLFASIVWAVPGANMAQEATAVAPPRASPFGSRQGYLPRSALPDSLSLLPPPPAPGTAALAQDEAERAAAARVRETPRWSRATSDAEITPSVFSCAANLSVSAQTTPRTYALLNRASIDLALATYRAKDHYERVRPFAATGASTCTPAREANQRNDGSYPSGHSAIGWGWALILSELAPERANELLQRGRDFGESRIVCNVHWRSDVDAGRLIASATVARLHADAAFLADLAAARDELASTAPPRPESSNCLAEADSLRTAAASFNR